MSAGIAAAIVGAACKHPSVVSKVDAEEAPVLFVPFRPQLLHSLEIVGVDFVDSVVLVHR